MATINSLEQKRKEVLRAIEPICLAFGVGLYDYVVSEKSPREVLKLPGANIGCTDNSIMAIIDELIGYLFITRWCRHRSLGAFGTQTKNNIKRYWTSK